MTQESKGYQLPPQLAEWLAQQETTRLSAGSIAGDLGVLPLATEKVRATMELYFLLMGTDSKVRLHTPNPIPTRLIRNEIHPSLKDLYKNILYKNILILDISKYNNPDDFTPMTDEQAAAVRLAVLASRQAIAEQEVAAAARVCRKGAGPMLHN